jgi:hypothetical protein
LRLLQDRRLSDLLRYRVALGGPAGRPRAPDCKVRGHSQVPGGGNLLMSSPCLSEDHLGGVAGDTRDLLQPAYRGAALARPARGRHGGTGLAVPLRALRRPDLGEQPLDPGGQGANLPAEAVGLARSMAASLAW